MQKAKQNTETHSFITLTTANVFFPSTNNKTNIETFRKQHPELGEEENVINYKIVRLTLYT